MKKALLLISLLMCVSMIMVACGSEEETEETNDNPNLGAGSMLLGDDGRSYAVPHVFLRDGDATLLYRTEDTIEAYNLRNEQKVLVNLSGESVPSYGVTQYAVSDNYFVWNYGSSTYRYNWVTQSTKSNNANTLASGFCIMKDRMDLSMFVSAQTGGYLYRVRLDQFPQTDPDALLDPDNGIDTVGVQAFACADTAGFVGTSDGRLFQINLLDNSPTLGTPITTGEHFELMQYNAPYLVWLDIDGNVKLYNTDTKENVKLAVNIDPQGRATARIRDMRLHVDESAGQVWILWSDNSEGSFDIYMADLINMEDKNDYQLLTKDSDNQSFPFYHQGTLYWVDDSNDPEAPEIWKGSL